MARLKKEEDMYKILGIGEQSPKSADEALEKLSSILGKKGGFETEEFVRAAVYVSKFKMDANQGQRYSQIKAQYLLGGEYTGPMKMQRPSIESLFDSILASVTPVCWANGKIKNKGVIESMENLRDLTRSIKDGFAEF